MKKKKQKLTVKMIRKAVKQLKEHQLYHPLMNFKIRDSHLTVDGVVEMGDGFCYMHPNTFKNNYGEEEYQLLLNRPRVASPYKDDIKEAKD